MGFIEKNIVGWKNKTIEYQGEKLYILDEFAYKGVRYLYAIFLSTINNECPSVCFLYNEKGDESDIFTNVDDDDLFEELLFRTAIKDIKGLVKQGLNLLDQDNKK